MAQQQIQVDFGGSDTPADGWNLLQRTEAGLSNLQNSAGDVTDVGIRIDRMYWLQNNSGGDATSLAYPNAASKDSFVGRDNGFSSWQFSLTGLLPSQPYTLNFFASRMGPSDGRETQYEVLGETSAIVTLNASNNISEEAVASVVSNSAGEITVIVSAGPNNTNSQGYYYLGALKISPPESLAPTVSFIMPTSGAEFTEGSSVNVDVAASDSDGRISNVDLYVNGTFVRTERFIPYTWNDSSRNQVDRVLQELPVGTHVLKAVAVDDAGVTSEQSINIIVKNDVVNAVITPSRTECASPCTVIFSAEKTTAEGLDDHEVWSQLSYYWDFDTDESDQYGTYHPQQYTYVNADTSFEAGHVPLVTKTFFCPNNEGTCIYNVGMRAQNEADDFDDDFVQITVKSESAQWSIADTICVSNSLITTDDWSLYDTLCPDGAIKQSAMPDADKYNGKLVLVKKGDVFNQNVGTFINQSDFKIGSFGDTAEDRPEFTGYLKVGFTNIKTPLNAPRSVTYLRLDDARFAELGSTWPSNVYIDGLRIARFEFPMSFTNISLHDLDLDHEESTVSKGRIDLGFGTKCLGDSVSCSNVPFPHGAYISKVDIVGGGTIPEDLKHVVGMSSSGELRNRQDLNQDQKDRILRQNYIMGGNLSSVNCPVINFLGVTNSRLRRAQEHNSRIHGGWRLNIMRSFYAGEHYEPGKHKISTRVCKSNHAPSNWKDVPILNPDYSRDIEGRTRADMMSLERNAANRFWALKASRYQVINGNQIGDADGKVGFYTGGKPIYPSMLDEDVELWQDILVTQNTFEKEPQRSSLEGIDFDGAHYSTCVENTYADGSQVGGCRSNPRLNSPGFRLEPTPLPIPDKPGS